MTIYGYVRCSTNNEKQDYEYQIRELKKMGAEKIFREYESGTKEDRKELKDMLDTVVEGDTILATEVSRISRSTKQLCEIIEFVKANKIKLVLGNFVVDCTKELDPMTEGMLKMMGVFAEMERNMISKRVKLGMENAKAKGKEVGRPKVTTETISDDFMKYYKMYKEKKINKTELQLLTKLSRSTVHRYCKKLEAK